MTNPPIPAPSGAPESKMVAPRPRSRAGIHVAFSFPPAGIMAASETPIAERATNRLEKLHASPDTAVAMPQPNAEAVINFLGPKRSIK